jgi:hypothetical protein
MAAPTPPSFGDVFDRLCLYRPPNEARKAAHKVAAERLSSLYTAAASVIAKAKRGHGQDYTVLAAHLVVFGDTIRALLPSPTAEATILARTVNDWRMSVNRIVGAPDISAADTIMQIRSDDLENAVHAAITFEPLYAD